MGMGQEFKDFINGFERGYKLATPTDAELKAREKERDNEAIDAAAGDYASGIPGRGGVKPYTYGGGESTPEGAIPGRRTPSFVTASSDPTMQAYLTTTIGKESGGNPSAKNPRSTATGLGQFTRDTWAGLMRDRPDLNLTANGRTDPEQSERALVAFTEQNRGALQKAGYDPTPGNLYVAHFLGASGAKRMLSGLNEDPNKPASAYADPAAVNANREVFFRKDGTPKTAAEFYRERTSKYGQRAEAEVQPVQFAAEGGVIMPVMQMPDDTAPPLPPRRPSDAELQIAPGNNSEEPDYHRIGGLHDALDAGIQAISARFGFDDSGAALPQARPDRDAKLAAYHRNEGAATPDEVRAIDQRIDPDNRLSADAKAIARLKAGYDYFLRKGEPDRAKKYSESILLYTRQAVQYAGMEAEQKIRAGDIAGAAKTIQNAHNQIPDGSTLYVDKVGPNGTVDYRMVDEDGDLTERGQATANQLLYLATGMRNGNEWLSQMQNARSGSLTAAQKLAEKRRQTDESAANSYFGAGGGNQDFIASMSPEAKAAFDKMSPALKDRVQKDWYAKQRADRSDRRLEMREEEQDRRVKTADRKGQDQQEYAGHAAAIENARDALAEQMQIDPDDAEKVQAAQKALKDATTAARSWAAGDSGRASYVPQLERLGRVSRTGGGGAGGGSARGGTADERKVAGLDQQYTRLERAANREADPQKAAQLKAALPHQRAGIEFQKRDTGYNDELGEKVDDAVLGVLGLKEGAELNDQQNTDASDYGTAMTGLLRGDNGLTPKRAGDIAKLAVRTGKIELLENGAYSINGSDPVFMPPQAVAALARLRQRNKPKEQPGTTSVANPFGGARDMPTPDEMDRATARAGRAAEREQNRPAARRRDKSAEYGRLREQMGDEMYARVQRQYNVTDDTVPLSHMRKVVREQLGNRARSAITERDINIP